MDRKVIKRVLAELIGAYIRKFGCRDRCETCRVGVAIGLTPLDKAYQAGYRAGFKDGRRK